MAWKNSDYIIVALLVFAAFIVIILGYGVTAPFIVYLYMLAVPLISIFLVTVFYTRSQVFRVSDTMQIMGRIKEMMNSSNLHYRVGDMVRFSECHFEGNNTKYKAYRFKTEPAEEGGVIVAWNVKENDIADIYPSPDSESQNNLFALFNPFIGKYMIPDYKHGRAFVPLELRPEEPKKGEIVDER